VPFSTEFKTIGLSFANICFTKFGPLDVTTLGQLKPTHAFYTKIKQILIVPFLVIRFSGTLKTTTTLSFVAFFHEMWTMKLARPLF